MQTQAAMPFACVWGSSDTLSTSMAECGTACSCGTYRVAGSVIDQGGTVDRKSLKLIKKTGQIEPHMILFPP